ncbi:sensor histidine kinase KdpD [Sphingomonas sp. LHG3406-1]|uniref:sensor histidine kinase n=1 Tax=Sphingomonas sp. LHG3406-1 TaxID=2804617 RepID=UPI002612BF8C|nr:PAS domain-containing sensor histidine kinase [Sphingomonas sp. LHG3406-1]
MASLPAQPPIAARVDRDGRLVAADAPLLALQQEAGGRLGSKLAVPQLAGLARLAARLGVAITRPVTAASEEEDLDLVVRAEPDADGVALSVERWTARLPVRSRWSGAGAPVQEEERAAEEDVVTDSSLRIVSLSPGLARRLGKMADDLVGQPLARAFRPVEDAAGNLPLLEALAGRTHFSAQPAELRAGEGAVLLDGQPRLEDGRFLGYVVRVRRDSSTGTTPALVPMPPLDDLLREPLASIIGQAQEIAGRSQGPLKTDYAGYGADIAAAARHLLDLLTDLGADGDEPGSPAMGELVDLAELVLDAAGLVQAQAAARGVMLDVGGEGRAPARGQPRAITQILVNLIGNAVRFSPEGGTVAINLGNGTAASVTVTDQGPGVAPGDRVRIFEKFEQGASAEGGSGLGLAISRRLAREMGGEVALLDGGAGASFRLTLPSA